MQVKIVEFATSILNPVLSDSDLREEVLTSFSETELSEFCGRSERVRPEELSIKADKSMGRQKITAKDVAKTLRYNSHYFSRKAKSWGLTKIRMSRTSCRYFLGQIEQLTVDRGIRRAT